MNSTTASGKFDQMKGKAKQAVGEAIGNERLADSGAVDQVKGAVKEAWGYTKEAAHAVASDRRVSAYREHIEAKQQASTVAHDVRSRLTSTAQNVKDAVSTKARQIQREHRPPA